LRASVTSTRRTEALPAAHAKKRWFSAADSSAFCQLSLPEDAIPRKRTRIRDAEPVPKNV
jgi:hypothetical protein